MGPLEGYALRWGQTEIYVAYKKRPLGDWLAFQACRRDDTLIYSALINILKRKSIIFYQGLNAVKGGKTACDNGSDSPPWLRQHDRSFVLHTKQAVTQRK